MAETITKTGAELFGETKTAEELFGDKTKTDFQHQEEIPSGDKYVFGPAVFWRPEYLAQRAKGLPNDVLFGKDSEWDDLLPFNVKYEIRDALVDWGDYDENGSRVVNAIYFAEQFGIEPEEAFNLHDTLSQIMFDKVEPPTKMRERIKDRWNNGQLQIKIMNLAYNQAVGKGDYDENLKAIQKLRSQQTSDYMKNERILFERMVGGTAETLPYMLDIMAGGVKAGLVGAGTFAVATALLGQVPPITATPEEFITVPAAAKIGFKAGAVLGGFDRARRLMTGQLYLNLLELEDPKTGEKIDPRIVKVVAHVGGSISGGIETAELAVILGTFGIGTKVFQAAAHRTSAKLLAAGTLKQIALKYALKFGFGMTVETAQELAQESSDIVFERLAIELNNELKGTGIKPPTKAELLSRYRQTAYGSLEAFPLLLAPGTIGMAAIEAITVKPKVVKPPPAVAVKPPPVPVEPRKPVEAPLPLIAQQTQVDSLLEAATGETELFQNEKGDVLVTEQTKTGLARTVVGGAGDIDFIGSGAVDTKVWKAIEPTEPGVSLLGGVPVIPPGLTIDEMTHLGKEGQTALREGQKHGYKIGYKQGVANTIAVTNRTIDALRVKTKLTEKNRMDMANMVLTYVPKEYQGRYMRRVLKVNTRKNIEKLTDQIRVFVDKIAKQERINKAVKAISKPVSKDVDFFYREAIEVLRSGIEFKPPRIARTIRRAERQREFLERATPEQLRDFPVKLAEKLARKSVEEYTVEELERLADEIEKLKRLGKTKRKARVAIEKTQREKNIKSMVKTMTGAEKLPPQPARGYETDKEGVITKLKAGYLWALRIPRILDWIDGRKGTFKGLAHTLFYGRVNEQYDAELRTTDKRHDAGDTKMEELGITKSDLVQVIDFSELADGFKLLVEQMMGVYLAVKNNMSLDALVHGNKITQEMANIVIGNLDQRFKDFADWIVEDYQESYPRLREAHIEYTNVDLGHEDNYSPIVRMEKNEQVTNEEIGDQLLQRLGLRRGYAEKGFTIDRKNIAPEHQKPINLRAVSVWRGQVARQEHYIHFAKLLKDMRQILVDSRFKGAVTAKLGSEGLEILNKWVSAVANPNIYKGFTGIENLFRQLRGNIAMAYLSYNLLTISKQLPSLIFYTIDAGPAAILSSLAEFVADPKKMWTMVRDKDPQVRHAFIEREMIELRKANKNAAQEIIRKVGVAGFLGIGIMDATVRTIGWNAVYQKNLANGSSEMEAVREAQHATLRTQPAAHAKDLAQLYRSNEILNWFTMFTNQLNQIFNIATYDTFAYWNNKNYQAAAASIMAVSINALVIWMLVNKKLPEDEDDLLEAATDQAINSMPLVGKSIMAGKRGWGSTDLPVFEISKDVGRIISAKDKEAAALRVLETAAALKGVPVVAIRRGKKFIETAEPVELIGGKKRGKRITIK